MVDILSEQEVNWEVKLHIVVGALLEVIQGCIDLSQLVVLPALQAEEM